ncbi:sensor histidine kinase [Paenibacillus sp. sptzw28]|uniref:sensor histidine kinase n=1 Tax=Paenibacillus sp. sptzw28 TaxID=715179 RepID=UPI001C6E6E2C|nr:sensor histidine kinase [Paenibacillus sp. sptzw28]QYR23055.1 sensor histidine kinase [Paenibacillus sp. sptzw28]
MKGRIKNKILGSAVLIVTLSLVACGLLAFGYFYKEFEKKTLHDGQVDMRQAEMQMNQLIDDIRKYSANMVNDEMLQKFAGTLSYGSVYSELSAYNEVVQQLTKFNVLRDYLDSSAIIRPDGKVFWSTLSFDPSFQSELLKPWYRDAVNQPRKSGFTLPHPSLTDGNRQVISFFIRFAEPEGGLLLLNIKTEAFTQVFDYLNDSFDHYLWTSSRNGVIRNNGLEEEEVKTVVGPLSADLPEVTKDSKGYYLAQRLSDPDWALVTFLSRDRFYGAVREASLYLLGFIGICILLCFLLFLPIVSSITKPISSLSRAMKQVSIGNYDVQVHFHSQDELMILKNGFELMLGNIKRQIEERTEQERWKRRMSAELLFAQINPHFIYNTLNTVIYLARKKSHDSIIDMVESFIGILQDAVHIGEGNLHTTVHQEMKLIDHYVAIQRHRYGGKFDFVWEVEEGAQDCRIPKSLLQPLVENAIFHGVSGREEPGSIGISIREQGETLRILVWDDGIGMSPEMAGKLKQDASGPERTDGPSRIGIRNIRERIHHLCGDAYGLEIASEEGVGTEVVLTLPLIKENH